MWWVGALKKPTLDKPKGGKDIRDKLGTQFHRKDNVKTVQSVTELSVRSGLF